MACKSLTAAAFVALAASQGLADTHFHAPGDLLENSGEGVKSPVVFFPDMRFPMESGPAYANSHAFSIGGAKGPEGDSCDAVNYSYPWRDNFCEFRRSDIAVCSSGGHSGQDLRPATCEKGVHWTVAATDGVVSHIGRFAVTVQSPDGALHRYVHLDMDSVTVAPLDRVKQGDRIGTVSNSWLTEIPIHLHYDIRQPVQVGAEVHALFLPPYSSLVAAYEKLD
ncbi:M23 family metallopeptidase [Epibacterium sp. Ofav1-8]|uniref:M23 family metallopeptidase n=1 Tax=Epibacterium sp. Ofav1-8 TaxID=2917735 RepID=UPI001EF588C9|nr:M23 family metallopeptidase [Epibacterium sp. Ofav1-8]MCG7625867.1 M23 family metallopeptidase [Epibacterium sp. Ofav1-8]